ncbi:MAG: BlaI/MecI/CopY family transcriptional regulator [Bryobacteraceae bacterium]
MRQARRNRVRIGANANPRSDSICIDADFSRRERQIMCVLYKRGFASGQEIQQSLADSPSYSTVRTILRILERKGWVRHTEKT